MFCKQCGANIPDGAKFCNACGANLDGTNQSAVVNKGNTSSKFNIKKVLLPLLAVIIVFLVGFGVIKFVGGMGDEGSCKNTFVGMIKDLKSLQFESKSVANLAIKYMYIEEGQDEKEIKDEIIKELDNMIESCESRLGLSKSVLKTFEEPFHTGIDALNIKINEVEKVDSDEEKRCKVTITYKIPRVEKLMKEEKTKDAIKKLKKIGLSESSLLNGDLTSGDYKKISKIITSWLKDYKKMSSDDYKKEEEITLETIKQNGKWKIDTYQLGLLAQELVQQVESSGLLSSVKAASY